MAEDAEQKAAGCLPLKDAAFTPPAHLLSSGPHTRRLAKLELAHGKPVPPAGRELPVPLRRREEGEAEARGEGGT